MSQYKIQPPVITLKRLDEPPFEVECREFLFGFIVPELGQESWATAYEYPGPKFWERRELKVRRKARVHDVECFEIQNRAYDTEGNLVNESANFAKIDRGYVRTYAFLSAEGENIRIYTWKDNGFSVDWDYDPGTPIRIVDVGKWRFVNDQHFTDGSPAPTPTDVNPNGAGLWEVHIDESVHRCLRVLEPGKSAENTMVETFVNCHGRTMLARRYNGSRWAYGSKRTLVDGEPREWTELLPDAPILYYNDICFVLWDFLIPDIALVHEDA
jgi:hypothetical protein